MIIYSVRLVNKLLPEMAGMELLFETKELALETIEAYNQAFNKHASKFKLEWEIDEILAMNKNDVEEHILQIAEVAPMLERFKDELNNESKN